MASFLLFRLLPGLIGSPWRLAADHEHNAPAAPVREYDAAVEERYEPILRGGAECRSRREFALGERAGTVHQRLDGTRFRVRSEADLQPRGRLIADAVLLPKPHENAGCR